MNLPEAIERLKNDPVLMGKWLWPQYMLYNKQREVLWSIRRNDETIVPAANMMGKDFIAGMGCVIEYLCHPVARIVNTSVKDDHLRVLWGEIGRFISTARVPLRAEEGGPLIVKHRDILKVIGGSICDISYLRGMVSEKGEGMAGHHAAYTLGVIDEASGVSDLVYTQMDTWAKRKLIFGNCNPASIGCTFFKSMVDAGDLLAK